MSTHLIKNVCFFVPTKNVVITMDIHVKIKTLHRLLPLTIKNLSHFANKKSEPVLIKKNFEPLIIIHSWINTIKQAAVHIQN